MDQEELSQLDNDLAYARRVIKDDEGNGGPYDRYVAAVRLILEKADDMERHANEVPDLDLMLKVLSEEYRRIVVNAVLFGQDELPGHPKDVTP
jgi:hypothetical protein